MKRIPELIIRNAIQSIDTDEYWDALNKEALKKQKDLIKEKDISKRKAKWSRYLLSKGFEMDLVLEVIKEVGGAEDWFYNDFDKYRIPEFPNCIIN